jgi:hypothetical protein
MWHVNFIGNANINSPVTPAMSVKRTLHKYRCTGTLSSVCAYMVVLNQHCFEAG